jgi:hypothetical protein
MFFQILLLTQGYCGLSYLQSENPLNPTHSEGTPFDFFELYAGGHICL